MQKSQDASSLYSMGRYECSVCHGNCDPGELVGGVCVDCLEEQRIAIVMQDKAVSLLNAPWEQMKLDFGGSIHASTNCNGC